VTDARLPSEASADATDKDAGPSADAACPLQADLSLCGLLPLFTGHQIVDGIGDDFCGYPALYFDILDGGRPDARTPTVSAFIQVAWSPQGLHALVRVKEAEVVPAASSSPTFDGDAIEIFASADGVLTGPFGGGSDKALQVVVSPPSATQPTEIDVATSVTGPIPALSSSDYAARLVDGGYNVELNLPWSTIAGSAVAPPDGGSSIGLDFACDVHGLDGGLHHQTILTLRVPPPPSCNQPYCDDRTWCLWKLAP
jgi:hypothetical protein